MSHQTISFVKSGIRILGYVFLLPAFWSILGISPALGFTHAVGFLVASELIGIYEEIGH